jgi:hypothetical protein
MQTSHLFHTIRLVWNSFMPRPLSVGTYKVVWFNPEFYTSKYLAKLLPTLYKELLARDNITDRHKQQLEDMQLPHLLAMVSTQHSVERAMELLVEPDDGHYVPEPADKPNSWDSLKGVDYDKL